MSRGYPQNQKASPVVLEMPPFRTKAFHNYSPILVCHNWVGTKLHFFSPGGESSHIPASPRSGLALRLNSGQWNMSGIPREAWDHEQMHEPETFHPSTHLCPDLLRLKWEGARALSDWVWVLFFDCSWSNLSNIAEAGKKQGPPGAAGHEWVNCRGLKWFHRTLRVEKLHI